ncbi:MAG: hypothetical protein ACOYEQ_04055 [Bacillota bacterium]
MNTLFSAETFREMGFSVTDQNSGYIKIEKGCCEISVRACDERAILELPVMKLWGRRETSLALMDYLLRRNGEMGGPGFFGIKGDCIYYMSVVYNTEDVGQIAMEMQKTIEKLGPRIINMAKQ